jgi:hypothetical protein
MTVVCHTLQSWPQQTLVELLLSQIRRTYPLLLTATAWQVLPCCARTACAKAGAFLAGLVAALASSSRADYEHTSMNSL